MAPNKPNPDNTNTPNVPNVPEDRPRSRDPRCRKCAHKRLECDICSPDSTNVHGNSKRSPSELAKLREYVRYCCKCAGVNKFSSHFDDDDKDDEEKIAPTKDDGKMCEAAAQLRSFLLETLKGGQKFCAPQLCGIISRFDSNHDDWNSGPGSQPIIAMSCRIPQPNFPNTTTIYLELNIRQVLTIVQRLTSRLSSEGPIDTAVLRTTLRTLFTHLAHLTHRAFPRQARFSQHGDKTNKARQHFSRFARDQVQTAYRELWYQALQTGFLSRVGSHGTQAGGLRVEGLDVSGLLVRLDQRAAFWQLLFRARELADKLRFWRAALVARR